MTLGTYPRVTRVAVIGDVHTESETLARVLDYVDANVSVDAVMTVGDLVDGEGDADATLELLRTRGVLCVAGNHERWFLAGEMRTLRNATMEISAENRAFIEQLPRTMRFTTPFGGAMLCHGVGEDDAAFLRPTTKGYDLQIDALRELMLDPEVHTMLGGHTHERMVRAFPGVVVVNAGTIRRDDQPGFVVVDFEARSVRCFDLADSGASIWEVAPLELAKPLPLLPEEPEDDWY